LQNYAAAKKGSGEPEKKRRKEEKEAALSDDFFSDSSSDTDSVFPKESLDVSPNRKCVQCGVVAAKDEVICVICEAPLPTAIDFSIGAHSSAQSSFSHRGAAVMGRTAKAGSTYRCVVSNSNSGRMLQIHKCNDSSCLLGGSVSQSPEPSKPERTQQNEPGPFSSDDPSSSSGSKFTEVVLLN